MKTRRLETMRMREEMRTWRMTVTRLSDPRGQTRSDHQRRLHLHDEAQVEKILALALGQSHVRLLTKKRTACSLQCLQYHLTSRPPHRNLDRAPVAARWSLGFLWPTLSISRTTSYKDGAASSI